MTAPQEMTKLLPCPFCGGMKIDLSEGTTFRWRYIGCGECGAQMEFRSDNRFEPTDETWKDAAEVWNRRASLSADRVSVPMDFVEQVAKLSMSEIAGKPEGGDMRVCPCCNGVQMGRGELYNHYNPWIPEGDMVHLAWCVIPQAQAMLSAAPQPTEDSNER